jgi:eukaryotic-like serine/threonine-protein kinase
MIMISSSKIIGKYEILEELGRGGFAVVYKARDVELDRIVALKVLHPERSYDPGFVARFKQEARAVARLRHPHIVTVFDATQIDERLIIAMQYVEGHTLRDELAQGPLPFERALVILEQIADALDYAHQQGVVHRDVKPANILLEETDQGMHATLLDFGLAKAMEASTALTSQGTLLGSPEYMAPEQADPNRANEIGPATDRYALGIVAYQLLTGRVPFPGNTPATLNAHLNLKPADPRTLRAEVLPQVSAVLLKMLSKSPRGRFPSDREFVEALRQASVPPVIHAVPRRTLRWVWGALLGLLAVLAVAVILSMIRSQPVDQVLPTPLATPITSRNIATEPPTGVPTLPPTNTPTRVPTLPSPPPTLGIGSLLTRTTDGMTMVYVPAGTFGMGGETATPVHDVTMDAFWIDRTEVTNAQYAKCVAAGQCGNPAETKSSTRDSYYGDNEYDNYPVISVSWNDADNYCRWIGGQLPTQAQWEYAARGPMDYTYPWGNDFDSARLNYCDKNCGSDWADKSVDDGYADTSPVGNYPQGTSWIGALDLAGNVWEWVLDQYGDSRGRHGGSWSRNAGEVTSVIRHYNWPDQSYNDIGFRCVMAQAHAVSATPVPTPVATVAPIPTTDPTLGVGSTRIRDTDGMTLVYVPGGTFKMGSETGNDDERPLHEVTLDAFWIDRLEVTNAQYAKCMSGDQCDAPAETKSHTRELYYGDNQYDNYPVIYVSWNDADKYCSWAGGQLATEAQWEYAARGMNGYTYPWGDDLPNDTLLNYNQKINDTTKVGSYPSGASWVGALDLAGNVWEWVQDWYGPYTSSSQTNPTGSTTGISRVLRGGAWNNFESDVRSTRRYSSTPDVYFGFRCAMAQVPAATSAPALENTPAPLPTLTQTPDPNQWRSEYYDNPNLQGQPVMVRNFPLVNFDWAYSSPGPNIQVDYFSARWTRSFNLDAGMYRFTARADDGVRVWLDSTLIIDEWHAATTDTYMRDINVPAGQHVVRVEYFEGTGTANINFNFDLEVSP